MEELNDGLRGPVRKMVRGRERLGGLRESRGKGRR